MAGASAQVASSASPSNCTTCGAALDAGTGPCSKCLLGLGLGEAPTPAEGRGDPVLPGRAGPFVLLEPLGEGGMGVVYLAEQQHPVRRRVALKLMKCGLDSRPRPRPA